MARQETTETAEATAMGRNLRLIPWWWVLRSVWLGEAIWVVYLTEQRGLTVGQVLAFEAVLAAVVLCAEVPTGMLADRFGRRLSLMLAGAVSVPAFVIFGVAAGPLLLLTAYAAFGVAMALESGADSAMLFDSLKVLGRDAEFTRRIGLLDGALTALIGVLGLAGALIVRWVPLEAPIIASGVLTVPAILLARRLREPPRAATERVSFLDTGRLAFRRVSGTPSMWAYLLMWVAGVVTISMMAVVLPVILREQGVPIWALGVFTAMQLLLATAGAWIAAPLARRVGLVATVGTMALLSPLSLAAGATGVLALVPLFLLSSVGFNVVRIHGIDFLSRRVPDGQRATVVSIASMTGNLGMVASLPTLGWAADGWGLGRVLVAAAIVLGGIALLGLVVWLRSGDTAAEPRPAEGRRSAG